MSSNNMNFSTTTNLPPSTTIVDEKKKQQITPPTVPVLFVAGGKMAELMEFPHMVNLRHIN